jgi:hypothetical protein
MPNNRFPRTPQKVVQANYFDKYKALLRFYFDDQMSSSVIPKAYIMKMMDFKGLRTSQ